MSFPVMVPSSAMSSATQYFPGPRSPAGGSGTEFPHGVSTAGTRFSTDRISGIFRGFAMRPLAAFFFDVFLVVTLGSCNGPAKPDGEVRVTTARELVKQYRDDPSVARDHFTGQLVRVRLTGFLVVGTEVHWKLAFGGGEPPVIVFKFADPPSPVPPCYIEGVCEGRTDDGKARDVPGYTFSVTLTGCRVVPGPPSGSP